MSWCYCCKESRTSDLRYSMQPKHEAASVYSVRVHALAPPAPSGSLKSTTRVGATFHSSRRSQRTAIPTVPNYKAVDTATVRLYSTVFSGELSSNGIFFQTSIYSSHRRMLTVFQRLVHLRDTKHCAVCTLLFENFCKYSVL